MLEVTHFVVCKNSLKNKEQRTRYNLLKHTPYDLLPTTKFPLTFLPDPKTVLPSGEQAFNT